MYLEHVRLPQLQCRSKVLTPILLSNLSLSTEHFAVFPAKHNTAHCSIHLHKITWERKSTIQGLLLLASKKPLKDKCNFPFALSVFQGVWSSVWVLFSSKSSKRKQHQNNKEQGVHEQENIQERLIYHLGLRNNIKEREMHGLHHSANWKETNLDFYNHSSKKKTVTLDTELCP